MKPRARWTVRILLVSFGLLLGISSMAGALEAASALGATTDQNARRTLLLAVAGGFMIGAGWIGVYVAAAVGFGDGAGVMAIFTRSPPMPGGFERVERAKRQIDGAEPYWEAEIARLRQYAEYRVAQRRFSPAKGVGWASLILVCAGAAVRPPILHADAMSAGFSGQVFRIIYTVILVLLAALAVTMWRTRTDVNAEAFLRRTAPVSWPAAGCH